jgi:GNAT superfamily N-acetyltransferase
VSTTPHPQPLLCYLLFLGNKIAVGACQTLPQRDAMVQTSIAAWLNKARAEKQDTIPVERKQEDGISPGTSLPKPAETQLREASVEDISSKGTLLSTKSLVSSSHSLPPNATITSITAETLPAFRRMTSLLLVVPYPDKFYNEILTDKVASDISLVCLWTSKSTARVVSGIRCRLLARSPAASPTDNNGAPEDSPSLYISTITTLAPYRGHGLAGALLSQVISRAIRRYDITSVTAHMWEANEDAKEWYASHGFRVVRFEEQYYRRLRPSGAWVLERNIGPQDLLCEQDGK